MSKKIVFPLFVFCYVLDQASKWAVVRWLEPDEFIEVIPGFFNIVRVGNTGAAFGTMSGSNTFFIFLTLAILIVLGVMAWFGAFRTPLQATSITLLAAGACGNFTDRIVHGHVVDFLEFILPLYGPWPAFNVADSCICIAAVLLIIGAFLKSEKTAAGGK